MYKDNQKVRIKISISRIFTDSGLTFIDWHFNFCLFNRQNMPSYLDFNYFPSLSIISYVHWTYSFFSLNCLFVSFVHFSIACHKLGTVLYCGDKDKYNMQIAHSPPGKADLHIAAYKCYSAMEQFKSMSSAVRLPCFKFWLFHLIALWLLVRYLTLLALSSTYKMECPPLILLSWELSEICM